MDKAFGNSNLSKYVCGDINKDQFLNHYKEELSIYYQNLINSQVLIYEPQPNIYA